MSKYGDDVIVGHTMVDRTARAVGVGRASEVRWNDLYDTRAA